MAALPISWKRFHTLPHIVIQGRFQWTFTCISFPEGASFCPDYARVECSREPSMSLRQAQPARATIRDVAAQAGVSVSSVSRVMNGEPHISPELHARIMRAVNRLRFEPHSAAQALRSRASKTIGCMVSDLSNPLYSEMINGAEEEFQRAGYVLMLAATRHEQDRETAFISAVRRRRMDGLLLSAGDNAHTDFTGALANLDLPCVAIDRQVPDVPSVRADHRGGGLEITRYLIGLGHRRIALLTGRAALLPSSERLAGYRQAHIEAKLEVDPDLIRPQTQGSSIAFSDVCQLLQGPDRPTAIITLGTHMLAGVHRRYRSRPPCHTGNLGADLGSGSDGPGRRQHPARPDPRCRRYPQDPAGLPADTLRPSALRRRASRPLIARQRH